MIFIIYLVNLLYADILEAERDSVSVECGVDYIEVTVNRTQLTGQYDELTLQMGNFGDGKTCTSWKTSERKKDLNDQGELSLHHFKAHLGHCGFLRKSNESHIIYEHELEARVITHDVNRVVMYSGKRYVFPVSCTYPVSLRTTLNFESNYTANIVELPSVTGIGRFRAAMALYEDGSFLTPFGLNPILQHDQTMYIGVFLLDKMTGGDNRKLVLKNCWASPSNSSNDEIKFSLIDRPGCSDHEMVKIIENGETTQARFTSEVFAFVGFKEVYLFCDISICFDDCEPGCDRRKRKRRSSLTDTYGDSYENQIISLGPIELSHGPEDGSEWDLSLDDSRMDLRTVALVCGIIATTFLIGLAGFFLYKLRRRDGFPSWFGIPGKFTGHSSSDLDVPT